MESMECEEDKAIARAIKSQYPHAIDIMPLDVLVGFIIGSRNAKSRQATALTQISTNLAWAALQQSALNYRPYSLDDCVSAVPDGRGEFEKLYVAGPVGVMEPSGACVVVEKIGNIPPKTFCKSIGGAEMIRQVVYNRQAAFAFTRRLSHRHGCNLRRMCVIIDMKGFLRNGP